MGRVFKRTRKSYTQIQKLRNGRAYYTSQTGTGPFIKMGRTAVMGAGPTPGPPNAQGAPAGTTVSAGQVVLIADLAEGHVQSVH